MIPKKPNEGCIFKWKPDNEGLASIQLEQIIPPCVEAKLYLAIGGEPLGPFCDGNKEETTKIVNLYFGRKRRDFDQ